MKAHCIFCKIYLDEQTAIKFEAEDNYKVFQDQVTFICINCFKEVGADYSMADKIIGKFLRGESSKSCNTLLPLEVGIKDNSFS